MQHSVGCANQLSVASWRKGLPSLGVATRRRGTDSRDSWCREETEQLVRFSAIHTLGALADLRLDDTWMEQARSQKRLRPALYWLASEGSTGQRGKEADEHHSLHNTRSVASGGGDHCRCERQGAAMETHC